MAPIVKLKISNPNNSDYPVIILRKFFNMIFIDHNGKKLHIYTATVFGGADRQCGSDGNKLKGLPKPEELPEPKCHDGDKNRGMCSLRFEYEIESKNQTGGADNVVSLRCKEIQDITKSLISKDGGHKHNFYQLEQLSNVWAKLDPLDTQKKAEKALNKLYPEYYSSETDKKQVEKKLPDFKDKIAFWTCGEDVDKTHQFIAYPGEFSQNDNAYTLEAAKEAAETYGLEVVNWIKTTIELDSDILKPRDILGRQIEFVIEFADGDIFYTPDFTWYFAPPPNYIVDDMSSVDIGCKKGISDIVTPVADRGTVQFREWLIEDILSRKKFRVLMKDHIRANPYSLSGSKVKVNLSFSNPKKHGNLQFLVGLLVSHFLGVCSDMGRLDRYRAACDDAGLCGPACKIFAQFQGCICENICNLLSILFPAAFILAFFAFCFRQNDCMPVKDRTRIGLMAIIGRWIGLCATVFLALYINLGWLVIPGVMQGLVKTCVANQVIVFVALLFSLVGNGFYTIYCWHFKKKHLIDFL